MKITGQDVVNVLALLALFLSALSIYLQIRVKGPLIELLNDKDTQQLIPRPYPSLPKDIQEKFPQKTEAVPGHALVKLIFGNSGDRVGIANIQDLKAKIIKSGEREIIKVSYNKYILVPAYAIVETEVLLTNIQLGSNTIELEIELTMERGGYNPDNTKYIQQGIIQKSIYVTLVPAHSSEIPWWIT